MAEEMSGEDMKSLAQELRVRATTESRDSYALPSLADVPEVTWSEMDEIVSLMRRAADALDRLASATSGTCSTCRFERQTLRSPYCNNPASLAHQMLTVENRKTFGCTLYDPLPTGASSTPSESES